MANYPNRVKDPTEAALSAIQDALNMREDSGATAPGAKIDPATASVSKVRISLRLAMDPFHSVDGVRPRGAR